MSLPRTSKDLNFISFLLPCITPKSWQKHQILSYSNIMLLSEFCSTIVPPKKFLIRKSSPKISPKNFLPKNSFQKNPPKKFQNNSKKNLKNFQTISQTIPNFWNIQFPTSHLEAENPLGLVFISFKIFFEYFDGFFLF